MMGLAKGGLPLNTAIFGICVRFRWYNLFMFYFFAQLFGLKILLDASSLAQEIAAKSRNQFSRQMMLLLGAVQVKSLWMYILFQDTRTNLQVWVRKSQLQMVHLKSQVI